MGASLRSFAIVIALAATASIAQAKDHPPELTVNRLVLQEGVEGFWGYYTRDVHSLMASGRLRVVPQLTWGKWRMRLDADVRHRTPFLSSGGHGLPQLQGEGEASLRFRPMRALRVTLRGHIGGRDRSGWPDQYQPTASGQLLPTDRYGGWWRGAGLHVGAIPIDHHHLRVSYEYDIVEFRHDPNYSPYERPTHLVPRSHDEHGGDIAWHVLREGLRLGGGTTWFYRHYFYAFSRDAGTGLTHAEAGGIPANPLQRLWGVDPSVDFELELANGAVTLDFQYTHHVAIDPYQGYRSVHGPHPKLRVDYRPHPDLELSLHAGFRRYAYFQGGYAQSANHPPLDSGSRRFDQRVVGSIALDRRFRGHFHFVVELHYLSRTTNFPDYQPGIFPASRTYAINWDYTNYRALIAVRYSL